MVVLLLILNGCAAAAGPGASDTALGARPADDHEKLVLAQAISPLLTALGYPVEHTPMGLRLRGDCTIALGIVPSRTINAAISPGRTDACIHVGLFVTEGALRMLPPGEMMALLAHELAHVHLGHLARPGEPRPTPLPLTSASDSTTRLIPAFSDAELTIDGPLRRFSPADEFDADRVAARLLFRVGRGPACLELAQLLERFAGAGTPPGAWLSTHPPPAKRARHARTLCDRGGPLTRPAGEAPPLLVA